MSRLNQPCVRKALLEFAHFLIHPCFWPPCKSLHFPTSPLQPWTRGKYVSPKRWQLPASLRVRYHKFSIIFKLLTVSRSCLPSRFLRKQYFLLIFMTCIYDVPESFLDPLLSTLMEVVWFSFVSPGEYQYCTLKMFPVAFSNRSVSFLFIFTLIRLFGVETASLNKLRIN
jgi:hypothetical protein